MARKLAANGIVKSKHFCWIFLLVLLFPCAEAYGGTCPKEGDIVSAISSLNETLFAAISSLNATILNMGKKFKSDEDIAASFTQNALYLKDLFFFLFGIILFAFSFRRNAA